MVFHPLLCRFRPLRVLLASVSSTPCASGVRVVHSVLGVQLHEGEGPIFTIKWSGIFIAWANDVGVKVYDTSSQERITYINRPKDSPRPELFHCRLAWKDDRTLLIGWADSVKVGCCDLSLSLSLCLSLSVSLCLSFVCLSLSLLCLSACVSFSLCVFLYLSIGICTCLCV